MLEIEATYSLCCGIFRAGDAEEGIMHNALPHERKVLRLTDVKELERCHALMRRAEEKLKAWLDETEYDCDGDSHRCGRDAVALLVRQLHEASER